MCDSNKNQGGERDRSRRHVLIGLAATGALAQATRSSAARGPGVTSTGAQASRTDATPFALRGSEGLSGSSYQTEAGRISILDFDVDPKGRNDSSSGFRAALRELSGGTLLLPTGVFLVEAIGTFAYAGQQVIGNSRWTTILRSESGAAPVFFNDAAARGTSTFHRLSDFQIDLNGNDTIAVDLASINASVLERIHIRGGGSAAQRIGTGVRFAAPLRRGAYDNSLHQCSFENLHCAVEWDTGANNNSVFDCRVLNCGVAYCAAPEGGVDTPRIFGGRVENCDIGLREGAAYGTYYGVRFEDSKIADIVFIEGSEGAQVLGGYTAGSKRVLLNMDSANSPTIYSKDLGYYAIEESHARPKVSTGRQIFGGSGKAPNVYSDRDYAAYFTAPILVNSDATLDFVSTDSDKRIIGMALGTDGALTISGFDRRTRDYLTINLGGGRSVRPLRTGTTNLGSEERQYRELHLSSGVLINGKKIIGDRQKAIPRDRSGAPNADIVNQILAVLRAHGLIDS